MPVRHVSQSARCQLSHSASYNLLASVPVELHAAIKLVFTGELLLTLKTDISIPGCLLTPIRHYLESPLCYLSNAAFQVLLTSVPTELQAAIEMVFTGKFLLILRIDISTLNHSLGPVRYVPKSPQCQLCNDTSHVLLASAPAKLQASVEMVFTVEFLLNLKIDILMPRYSLAPVRHVSESPRCQRSNGASHNLLASVSTDLQAAI
ncbi:hypothetical protein L873DRAFT_1792041 [Choiromyces venosus 120613-1]|uniref:Uncharacterized protein n=1 Tax=Choiromyces venosus 120613-1 TaxID=1336337 RepID=A0A3N4JHC5_9PEZI|nr:hypothetical protein L873DRAFT_1792041 [Choiromyces venosus 120613-1]